MHYLLWAILALLAYSLVPPLSKLASDQLPIMLVALIANVTITVVNLAVVLYLDEGGLGSLSSTHGLYAIAAGVFLTVGVLSYFHSLSIGPVSVVTPIFGLFLVGSSVIGMVAFEEPATARKIAGLGCAALAVYLTSTA
ncbi:EamA family transporter [Halorientalis marina]|uniref:EamA family transporter n=1 Tax=Halorientalis marina TaxID=2931976 RepID=UPI001FF47816|nr:EamA family transporter [Halorientalis marina]